MGCRLLKVELLIEHIKEAGIEVFSGVPDSTLSEFCGYLGFQKNGLVHYTLPDEGAAVGVAAGTYLSTGKPACVYMQNSGLGNMVNPVTSIAHSDVYNIPMLFIVGFRGEPGTKDEPQHKFMGKITRKMLGCLEIPHEIIDKNTTGEQIKEIFSKVSVLLNSKKQFALIVKKDTFEKSDGQNYENENTLCRENVISEIIKNIGENDLVVSTTGKISREVYEQSDRALGHHKPCFLTVGGMGHASMIAFGIAQSSPEKRVICIDGDGAVLMHMGGLAFIGQQKCDNLIHICLNNSAHESVGGMPTAAPDADIAKIAGACGYSDVAVVKTEDELNEFIKRIKNIDNLTFAEIKVANTSRDDLGRPKESAEDNAISFMNYLRGMHRGVLHTPAGC